MCSVEVESLIEQSVEKVLMNSPSFLSLRASLVDILVEALERDATWVEMYGISGELKVPGPQEEGTQEESLKQVKKVRSTMVLVGPFEAMYPSSWKNTSIGTHHTESGARSEYQLTCHT
jgi:hypothetical protein